MFNSYVSLPEGNHDYVLITIDSCSYGYKYNIYIYTYYICIYLGKLNHDLTTTETPR